MRLRHCVYLILIICCYSVNGFAQQANTGVGIGLVAGNMLGPIGMLRQLMSAASIVLGLYMLTAATTKYFRFRQNPQESPISTVIIWGILGIVLIIIPLLHHAATEAAMHTGAGDVVG